MGMMMAANPPPRFARQELQKILLREGPLAFHAFLDDWGIKLRPDDLTELAWFLMPGLQGSPTASREEHVFLVQVPDAEEATWATVGGTGFDTLFWATPSRALHMYGRGELHLTLMQWYVLHELVRSLPKLHALPARLAAPPSKDAPLWHPAALELCVGAATSRSGVGYSSLLLPGDEDHQTLPGSTGQRHRFLIERVGVELKVHGIQRAPEYQDCKLQSRL